MSLPFHGHPPSEVARQALAWRLLELRHVTGESVDLVIPTKFPSYLVRHHRKVAWVFHQYREAYDLLALTRELADQELAPKAAEYERAERFPREVFALLGEAGLLGLPFAEDVGGGAQPYEVYLQVLEEIASAWAAVGVATSVHALSCFGLFTAGTDEQKQRWLPEMLSGDLLGAYCLSEAHAGSDPAAMRTRAVREGDEYVLNGAKAWVTSGGVADFYKVMARTSDDGARGAARCRGPVRPDRWKAACQLTRRLAAPRSAVGD